jgi:hypothetical protein
MHEVEIKNCVSRTATATQASGTPKFATARLAAMSPTTVEIQFDGKLSEVKKSKADPTAIQASSVGSASTDTVSRDGNADNPKSPSSNLKVMNWYNLA